VQGPERPLVIGWKEYVELPDWGIRRLKVKIDTGARTSALDVHSYRLYQASDSKVVAELHLALNRKKLRKTIMLTAPVLGTVTVSNSSGMCEKRPLIETSIRLGPVSKRILVTVTDRSQMLFRMILGRKALEGDFVVDVRQKYLLGRGIG
jgi:hypothetical protein